MWIKFCFLNKTIQRCIGSGRALVLIALLLVNGGANTHAGQCPRWQPLIQKAQGNILALPQEDNLWNLPSFLGTHYVSGYSLFLDWLKPTLPRASSLDRGRLKKILLEQQLPDGSWATVLDAYTQKGDLSATITNYAFLKSIGEPVDSAPMTRARKRILSWGGIEEATLFTKIILAMFGNYRWSKIPFIPTWALNPNRLDLANERFAQWVTPHLVAIAYLRRYRVRQNLGPKYQLDELYANISQLSKLNHERRQNYRPTYPLIDKKAYIEAIIKQIQPKGSVGAYTLSTLLSWSVVQDYMRREVVSASDRSAWTHAISRFFDFNEFMNLAKEDYRGILDDGRYWDTALLSQALLESGLPPSELQTTGGALLSVQQSGGGFPFGFDFEYAPDTDDTSAIMLVLQKTHPESSDIKRAEKWLLGMQNFDGGWAAFSKNNRGSPALNVLMQTYLDSVDPFDESSPDITGHILEALGGQGYRRQDPVVRRAVRYLKRSRQTQHQIWDARWGINYLYGTAAVLVGLRSVGYSPSESIMQKPVEWLRSVQNSDGGFGESFLSYEDSRYAGVGVSTPSQTAWAMMGLLAGSETGLDPRTDQALLRAAQYLESQFAPEGRWIDRSSVGTGHPKIVYMQYPSYAYAFPLIAMSRYCEWLN